MRDVIYECNWCPSIFSSMAITKPDISFVVNLLASSGPTRRHWNDIQHILQYLSAELLIWDYFIRNVIILQVWLSTSMLVTFRIHIRYILTLVIILRMMRQWSCGNYKANVSCYIFKSYWDSLHCMKLIEYVSGRDM